MTVAGAQDDDANDETVTVGRSASGGGNGGVTGAVAGRGREAAWSSAPAPSATSTVGDTVERCRAADPRPTVFAAPARPGDHGCRGNRETVWWRTHDCHGRGTVPADTPPSASPLGGAGGHDFRAGWRDDGARR